MEYRRQSIRRILEHLGEPIRPPPIVSARGPPPGEVDFDRRELDAFALSDPLPVYEAGERVGVIPPPTFLPVKAY